VIYKLYEYVTLEYPSLAVIQASHKASLSRAIFTIYLNRTSQSFFLHFLLVLSAKTSQKIGKYLKTHCKPRIFKITMVHDEDIR